MEARWFFVMGVWMSLGFGISVSSDVNCWTIVDISFVWQVVILVSSDDLSKLPRAFFMMLSNKFVMKWVFCWHCWVSSNTISSTCEGRLSSEVISVVERQKESKFYGVLTLVIIFLSNNWDILTAMQPSSKLMPLYHFSFSNCFEISTVFTFSILLYCRQYLTQHRRWIFTIIFCLTSCLVWWGNRKLLKSYTDVFFTTSVTYHVWVMHLLS